MHRIRTVLTARWIAWDILLSAVFAAMVFVVLAIVSAGLLVSVVTIGVLFFVFGLVHYLLWGRAAPRPELVSPQALEPGLARRPDDVLVPLDESERRELLHLLRSALAQSRAAPAGPKTKDQIDMLREMRDRLRMFGA